MSDPTTPPPPTYDPSASAREWAGRDNTERLYVASVLRRERDVATNSDNPEAALPCAIARRVLADTPALLARLVEAERLLREANRASAKRLRALDSAGSSFRCGEWTELDAVWCKIDAFLAPSTPRAEGPSRE